MQISVAVTPGRQVVLQATDEMGKVLLMANMEAAAALALAQNIKSCAEMAAKGIDPAAELKVGRSRFKPTNRKSRAK